MLPPFSSVFFPPATRPFRALFHAELLLLAFQLGMMALLVRIRRDAICACLRAARRAVAREISGMLRTYKPAHAGARNKALGIGCRSGAAVKGTGCVVADATLPR